MDPTILFGIQFTLSLVVYVLIAFWYVSPGLKRLSRGEALIALLWIHAFRIVGGAILAPGAVASAVPMGFRLMIGIGDLVTAFLAILAIVALRARIRGSVVLVWICISVGLLDTLNAVFQSVRDNVFNYALGVNWVVVTLFVPALLVSSLLIFMQLLDPNQFST